MSANLKALFDQPETRTISAAEFKAKCLQLMDEVNEKKLTLIITKRGKPVMQAVAPPTEAKPFVPLFGRSPGITVPSGKEWKKQKAKWVHEWDDSAVDLARMLNIPKPKKGDQK